MHKLKADYYSISKSSAIFTGIIFGVFNFCLHSLDIVYYDYGAFMIFVGRENEANHIIRELQGGNNIVLGGKYGIGRTSLIKYLASRFINEWRIVFVDFSQTPWKMSEKLIRELGLSMRFRKTGKKMGYKSMRYRIANVQSPKKMKTVIVFDNVAKLTPQKIIFLQHLILEKHFQFIAIVENFLPKNDLFSLKAQLLPATKICLSNLNAKTVLNFLQSYSDKYHLNWSDAYIHNLANLIRGHPLSMIEMIRNIKRGNI